jgi:hypothetical protein
MTSTRWYNTSYLRHNYCTLLLTICSFGYASVIVDIIKPLVRLFISFSWASHVKTAGVELPTIINLRIFLSRYLIYLNSFSSLNQYSEFSFTSLKCTCFFILLLSWLYSDRCLVITSIAYRIIHMSLSLTSDSLRPVSICYKSTSVLLYFSVTIQML